MSIKQSNKMNKTLISNKRIVLLTILLAGFINQSCTYRVIDFTAISSKNVTLNLPENSKGQRVKGQDYVTTFLGIPWGAPNLKEATDQAIESAGGEYDALIDGVIYQKRKWYFLFGKFGYEVEGTPIVSKDIGDAVQTTVQERAPFVLNPTTTKQTIPPVKIKNELEKQLEQQEKIKIGTKVIFNYNSRVYKGEVTDFYGSSGRSVKITYNDLSGKIKIAIKSITDVQVAPN
jgi:ribosomal protein L35AE/L33A